MKSKIVKIISVLASILTICTVIYSAIEIKKLKDPNSIEYCIAVYEKEQSNYYLICLCNKLSIAHDKRLFKYFDDFMNMENFDKEVRNYENDNITDSRIDFYHDFMIALAFKTCAKNNDIDLLAEMMFKYYPQIRDKDKLFYLSLSNDGSADVTAFFKANAEKIIEVFEKLYAEEEIPKLKLRYLLEISSYYRCDEVKRFELYKEKHHDELAQLIDQCVSDSERENVAVLSAYFKSYWEHLLTGKENEGWNSAFEETWSKYEKVNNIVDVSLTDTI